MVSGWPKDCHPLSPPSLIIQPFIPLAYIDKEAQSSGGSKILENGAEGWGVGLQKCSQNCSKFYAKIMHFVQNFYSS